MVNVATTVEDTIMTGSTPMTATLSYLSRMTEEFFERQMRRAAKKINAGRQLFPRHLTAAAPCRRAWRARRFIFSPAI